MRFAPLVLGALCFAVLFTGLDRVGFLDAREARDAQVARELIARREVLTPVLGGETHLEKPVLGYAVEVAAQFLTPGSPFGGRVLKALLALSLVLVTGSVGARHFGPRAGLCAAGVLLTSLGLPLAARTDGTQLLASLLGWVGCAGLADAVFGRRAGLAPRLVVAYGALAATLLVAGPLPALWPLAGVALYLRLAGARDGWSRVRPLAGLTLMLGLALPWYGAIVERHGVEALGRALFFPYADAPHGPWYSGAVRTLAFLVVGTFPWSTMLPGAAMHAATWWHRTRRPLPVDDAALAAAHASADPATRERHEESAAHFYIACIAAALVPVVFYPEAPLTAALPALPAAALLCGRLLDHLFENPERVAGPLASASHMLLVVGSAGAVMFALVATRVPSASAELRTLGALLLLVSWAPFLANFIHRRRTAAALMALPVAVGVPLVSLQLLPAMEDYLSTRDAAEAVASAAPPRAPLVLVDPPPPSLRLYLEHNLIAHEPLARALAEYPARDGLTYLAFAPRREHQVARAAGAPLEILLRTPTLVVARVHAEASVP